MCFGNSESDVKHHHPDSMREVHIGRSPKQLTTFNYGSTTKLRIMARTKDERYDPSVNHDSDSESEMNNRKCSPPSSPPASLDPLDDIVVHNDFERMGGPLAESADNPQGRQCKNRKCRREVPAGHHMYGGNAFSCSTEDPLPIDYHQTHRFCKNCARLQTCPLCGGFKLDANYGRSPNKLKD